MDPLEKIGERIRTFLETKSRFRDEALQDSRIIIRHCSRAIRAIHRNEAAGAHEHLKAAETLIQKLKRMLAEYPDLYHAGYTQDAMKEYTEANIVLALLDDEALPHPDRLGVEYAAYLGGLGDAVGELRRRVLDLLRRDEFEDAERLLNNMDEIYGFLVTLDFPGAITGNLRRTTDMVRGVTERTRADLTTSSQQFELRKALRDLEKKLEARR
jgi:translin